MEVGASGNTREPCPDRIIDDVGGSFAVGTVGRGAWHFLKGFKNSPRGSRLVDATQFVRMNTPRTAGAFAIWGGVFSLTDCSLVYLRLKEDPWNTIAAGGLLQMRQGFRAASRSASFGGVLIGLIEGISIIANRIPLPSVEQPMILVENPNNIIRLPLPQKADAEAAAASPSSSSSSSSWFGWVERKRKKRRLPVD